MIKDIICESSKLLPGDATTAVVVSSDQQPTPSRREGGCYHRTGRGLFLQRRLRTAKLFSVLAILLIPIIIVQTSCKKFVQIGAPPTQFTTTSVFSSDYTANAAVTEIYTQMMVNSDSYFMAAYLSVLSDEQKSYSTAAAPVAFYTNNLLPSLGSSLPWINLYSYIYYANAVLENLRSSTGVDKAVARQLIGEAEFIRAFWLFYLTSLYGDVPLVTTTDYSINGTISRSPQQQVYQQIVTDLTDAQTKLNPHFVNATDTVAITTDRGRPTSWAATALLARVYLYMGNHYADAATQASAVINNSNQFGLYPAAKFDSIFLVNSREAIWQVDVPLSSGSPFQGYNTPDGYYFILTASPVTTITTSFTALSQQLLGAFEPGDLRRSKWVNSAVFGGVTYYYPYKYKVYTSSSVTEALMALRLAEQYLIRAEAEANGAGGGLSAAVTDLNIIRNRAGLANYSGTVDKPSVLAAILHERQVELFSEWGHRWFDLVRTGAVDTVLGSPGNVCQAKGGSWNTNGYQKLLPIPQNDINADPNLSQNAGY